MRTYRKTMRSYGLPALLIPLFLHPVAGVAQEGAPTPEETPSAVMAKSLQVEAESLLAASQRSTWSNAAALYEEAAEFAGYGTTDAVEYLRKAAFLRHYLGENRLAFELMEAAAGQAIATGQVLLAANSYIDGVWLAMELDRTYNARELGEKARLLAESPHLTEADRGVILDRVGGHVDSPSVGADTF